MMAKEQVEQLLNQLLSSLEAAKQYAHSVDQREHATSPEIEGAVDWVYTARQNLLAFRQELFCELVEFGLYAVAYDEA